MTGAAACRSSVLLASSGTSVDGLAGLSVARLLTRVASQQLVRQFDSWLRVRECQRRGGARRRRGRRPADVPRLARRPAPLAHEGGRLRGSGRRCRPVAAAVRRRGRHSQLDTHPAAARDAKELAELVLETAPRVDQSGPFVAQNEASKLAKLQWQYRRWAKVCILPGQHSWSYAGVNQWRPEKPTGGNDNYKSWISVPLTMAKESVVAWKGCSQSPASRSMTPRRTRRSTS